MPKKSLTRAEREQLLRLRYPHLFEPEYRPPSPEAMDALQWSGDIERNLRLAMFAVPDSARVAIRKGIEAREGDKSRGQARRNQQRRVATDEYLLPKFVALINRGEVTKSAASILGIGIDRAKRLRGLAVKGGLLPRRRRR